MYRSAKLLFCLSFIFFLAQLTISMAAEEDSFDQYESFVGSAPSSVNAHQPIDEGAHERALYEAHLEDTFSTAMAPEKYWGWKALGWAAVTGVTSFVVWQGIVPMGMKALEFLGVTENVVASGTPAGNALLAAVAIPILINGIAATRHLLYATEKEAPHVRKAKQKTEKKSFSWIERATYPVKKLTPWCPNIRNIFQASVPTKAVQLFLWGGLGFAFLYDIEAHITGWGPPQVWQYGLGAAWTGITYVVIVRADRDPSENLLLRRLLDSPEEKALTAEGEQDLRYAIEYIKLGGADEDTLALGIYLNAVQATEMPDQGLVEMVAKRRYQNAYEKIKAISVKVLPRFETYDKVIRGISEILGPAIQFAATPMAGMTMYYLTHELARVVCNASPEVSKGFAIASTIVASAPLVGSLISGIPSTFKEVYQTLRLWKPKNTIGTTGGRIMTISARGATFLYVVFPLTYFADIVTLQRFYGIDNLGVELALLLPFAGVLWAPTAQFFEDNHSWIFNWVSKGTPVTGVLPFRCCPGRCEPTPFAIKMLPCVDPGNDRKNALESLENLLKFQTTFRHLITPFKKIVLGKPLNEEDIREINEGGERGEAQRLLPADDEEIY